MNRTRISRLAAWAITLGMASAPVLAGPRLPRITEAPSGPRFWMYAVFVLLLAGVVFAASLKSKRGHQD
ncbi:MAG: hypothetical protein LAT64_05275 [Phycisphaerales bacterium]|nr:hypothetical protein [Planctomycetota bacterium]MCH8508166.1 hypothetical protein [Phycisphaerales bacterium]